MVLLRRGQQFYDPIVQAATVPMPAAEPFELALQVVAVDQPGVYVRLADVVAALRHWATADPGAAEAYNAAAEAFLESLAAASPTPLEPVSADEASTTVEWPSRTEAEMGLEAPEGAQEPVPGVDRVEIYPDDPEAPRPRWVARAVDADGRIVEQSNGSIDQDYEIRAATLRWPDVEVRLVADASVDTVWEEKAAEGDAARGIFSGKRRPSTRRLWQ